MFVHSEDKLAEMRTNFHVIQVNYVRMVLHSTLSQRSVYCVADATNAVSPCWGLYLCIHHITLWRRCAKRAFKIQFDYLSSSSLCP